MFLLRTVGGLAARYGLNVDALLAETDPEQFNQWIAMYQLEPWGDDWVQTGKICAAVCSAAGAKDVSPLDFIPGEIERTGGDVRDFARKYER